MSSPTPAPVATRRAAPPTGTPTAIALPAQPLRAWDVAATDGTVYVIDAAWRVYQLAPQTLAIQARSEPLFPSNTAGPARLLADGAFLFAGSEALTRTLVLGRADLGRAAGQVRTLAWAGPMALEPNQRLFVIREHAIWVQGLADLDRPPQLVRPAPPPTLGWIPTDLAIDLPARQLYVTLHDTSASPPHQHETYAVYDLDTLAEVRRLPPLLGTLSHPAFAPQVGRVVSMLSALNGFLGSQLTAYDRQGNTLRSYRPLDGVPVTDAAGGWIYLLRDRGLWMLRGDDFKLQSVLPFAASPPAGLALAPDGATLYLLGGGWLTGLATAELRTLGVGPVTGGFPLAWAAQDQPAFFQARVYPSPAWEQDGTAFALVGGYGEIYRTTDAGRSWQFLPGLTYPDFHYLQYLSLSPDFGRDRTLVAAQMGGQVVMRSTDAGDTWHAWTPPMAFVSDRDGNREIYVADQQGKSVRRLTANRAADENPAWSPGWTRVAFQSNRNGNWDIFTIRADCDPAGPDAAQACDLRQVTADPADDMLPAWSPDGRSIAFVSTRSGNPNLYVIAAGYGPQSEDRAARRLTDSPAGDWRPAWLPDSRHLVFTSSRSGNNDIWRVEIPQGAAGAEKSIPQASVLVSGPADDRDPAVSGTWLAFLSDRDGVLRAYTLDMSYAAVARPACEDRQTEGHPAWLADGSHSLLVAMQKEGQEGIYRAEYLDHVPLVVSAAYNGQPAAGPVLWEPDPAASYAWLTQQR